LKKKLLLLLSIIFVFTITLFGCGAIDLSGGPKLTDTVYGNGGSAVVKGDYLFFANAFIDYNDLNEGDNKYDKNSSQAIYGIYRTKLVDGAVELNSNGVPKGAELLVPQVGGYSNAGIYICGNYVYYSTPYTAYEKGNSQAVKGLLRFERVNLQGQDHLVLSEGEYKADCEYKINYVNGITYITIFSGENINVIKVKDNGDKSTYELASGVKTMAVASQEKLTYNAKENAINTYVYYTKEDNGNYSLLRKSFSNGNEEILIPVSTNEVKLVKIKNSRVYFTLGDNLFSSTFTANEKYKVYTDLAIKDGATDGIVDYQILDDTYGYAQDRGLIVVYKGSSDYSIMGVNGAGSVVRYLTKSKQINLVLTTGNEIYYQISEDDALYCYNTLQNKERVVISKFVKNTETTSSSSEGSSTSVTTFDYDSERIFFYTTATKSNGKLKYLHIALLNNNVYKNSSNESVGQYIGVLASSDVKSED